LRPDAPVAPGLQIYGAGTPGVQAPIHPDGDLSVAEIRVEPKRRSMAWLWILLTLIVVGGLVYYFFYFPNGKLPNG
jgi:hypothetical protein